MARWFGVVGLVGAVGCGPGSGHVTVDGLDPFGRVMSVTWAPPDPLDRQLTVADVGDGLATYEVEDVDLAGFLLISGDPPACDVARDELERHREAARRFVAAWDPKDPATTCPALTEFLEVMADGDEAPAENQLRIGFSEVPDGREPIPERAPGEGADTWGLLTYRTRPAPLVWTELRDAWNPHTCVWEGTPDLADGESWALGRGWIDAKVRGEGLRGRLEADLFDGDAVAGGVRASFDAAPCADLPDLDTFVLVAPP